MQNSTLNTIHSTRNCYSNGLYINLNRCPYKRQVCSYKTDFRRSKNDKGKRNGNQKTQEIRRQKGRTWCGVLYVMCRIVYVWNDSSEIIRFVDQRQSKANKLYSDSFDLYESDYRALKLQRKAGER